VTFRKTLILQ